MCIRDRDKAEEALNTRIDVVAEELSKKADNVVFNEEDGTLQLMCGEDPIGDSIIVKVNGTSASITNMGIDDSGELIATFSDGTEQSLGVVVGSDGAVFVPHISEQKVLTWTIETEAGELPDAVDLNPNDEWSGIDDSEVTTDYVWESM